MVEASSPSQRNARVDLSSLHWVLRSPYLSGLKNDRIHLNGRVRYFAFSPERIRPYLLHFTTSPPPTDLLPILVPPSAVRLCNSLTIGSSYRGLPSGQNPLAAHVTHHPIIRFFPLRTPRLSSSPFPLLPSVGLSSRFFGVCVLWWTTPFHTRLSESPSALGSDFCVPVAWEISPATLNIGDRPGAPTPAQLTPSARARERQAPVWFEVSASLDPAS